MTRPTTLAERLRLAMSEADMNQSELARRIGSAPQTIQSLLSGQSKSSRHGAKIASVLKVNPLWLETGEGPMVNTSPNVRITLSEKPAPGSPANSHMLRTIPTTVLGHVQAGLFQEALEWPHGERWEVSVPIAQTYSTLPTAALEVRGPSMDQIYPHGSLVVVVKLLDLGREPRSGEKVVVHRRLANGLTEASVKEFRVDRDGQPRLWPRSTHPDFQSPLPLTSTTEEEVTITHLVIGSYRPEA